MKQALAAVTLAAVAVTAPGCIIGFGHPSGIGGCGGVVGCGDCCGGGYPEPGFAFAPADDGVNVMPEAGPQGRFFPVPSQPALAPREEIMQPSPVQAEPIQTPASGQASPQPEMVSPPAASPLP